MNEANDYWLWWKHKLLGRDLEASEGTPFAGFYRMVRKAHYGGIKFAIPVAYWPGEKGELHCREGSKDVSEERGCDIWINVCNHAVPEDWYREVAERDAPEWPDGMATSPPKGDNKPPEGIVDFDYLKSEIEKYAGSATERLTGPPITEQTQADKISNLANELGGLWQLADKLRKAERAPHDEALKAIQLKWLPLLGMAEAYRNLKFKLLTPWLLAQEKKAKEEAEAAAAAGETGPEAPRRPRAGTRGRAMTLKTFKTAEITDYDLCLKFFKDSQDIRATLQDLANKAVRAGVIVPGAKLIEDQRTV